MNAEPNADYPQVPRDDWRLKVEREIGEIKTDVGTLKDGAAVVVDRLEEGSEEISRIKTDTALILQKLDDEPDGLIAKVNRHDSDIRELREDAAGKRGAREWWKHPLVIAVCAALIGFGVNYVGGKAHEQVQKADALCATKFESLDAAHGRGAYSQSEYEKQLQTLVSQGCTR